MKQIKLSYIKKLNSLQMDIHEEYDNSYPDYRVIGNKERAITNTLKKITNNIKEQNKIEQIIDKHLFNMKDTTFKCICEDLRALGYEIVYG